MITRKREDERVGRRGMGASGGEQSTSSGGSTAAASQAGQPTIAALPARYGMIALGSGLLMLASVVSTPLGPAATTAPRELLTLVSAVVGIWLLARASLAAPLSRVWGSRLFRYRRLELVVALLLAIGTLATIVGATRIAFTASGAQSYAIDDISLAHEDARLVLAGKNPYRSDSAYRDALTRFPHALSTPLRGQVFGTGYDQPGPSRIQRVQRRYTSDPSSEAGAFAPASLHSYPALSFLLYVPFLWAGVQNIGMLHILLYWCLFAWLVWLTPVGWRHWGTLVALAAMPTVAASLILTNEVVVIALIVTAWHLRRRGWLGPLLLGLACAYKQYAWFFVPFFLVDGMQVAGWRDTLKRGVVALGAFLVPNLPYIIASPRAWFASLWLPMSEPLFAWGMGIVTLPIGHLVPYGWPLLYAVMEVGVLVALVWLYARHRSDIGDGALVLALLPLFFAFRSLPSYFAFLPWLALYAASRHYARTMTPQVSPVVQACGMAVRSAQALWHRGACLAPRAGHLSEWLRGAGTNAGERSFQGRPAESPPPAPHQPVNQPEEQRPAAK